MSNQAILGLAKNCMLAEQIVSESKQARFTSQSIAILFLNGDTYQTFSQGR